MIVNESAGEKTINTAGVKTQISAGTFFLLSLDSFIFIYTHIHIHFIFLFTDLHKVRQDRRICIHLSGRSSIKTGIG